MSGTEGAPDHGPPSELEACAFCLSHGAGGRDVFSGAEHTAGVHKPGWYPRDWVLLQAGRACERRIF